MVDRYDNAMGKLIENQNKLASRSERLQRLKTAYEQVKGTGMTQRQVQKAGAEANVKKLASASKLGSGWKKGTEDGSNYMYRAGTKVNVYTNGDFKIAHNWQRYELFIKGKSVGRYMTLKKAKEMAGSK